ncbi:hypothetical protein Chor_002537 [Crotalus horridus]
MKSRARQPLILKKRKTPPPPTPLQASPAEDAEAGRRAGRVKQEPRLARQLRGIPASPGRVGAGERLAPLRPPGLLTPAQGVPERPAPERSPGKDPGGLSLCSQDSSLGPGPFQDLSGSEEESLATSRGAPEEEEQLSGIWPWSPEECTIKNSVYIHVGSEESVNSGLSSSLTNIQWLGKMSSTALSSCSVKKDTEKENQTPEQKTIKNSVRHNLSLHDMFVRETSANGKIAFWTIHPEANRYLTLDQVFKQQKRPTLDLQKNAKDTKVEAQISLHFPTSEPFHLPLPSRPPLPADQTALGTMQGNPAEHPAPKILRSSEESVLLPSPSSIKEEKYCGEESCSLNPQRPLEEGSCTDSGKPLAGVLSDSFLSPEWVSSFLPLWPVKEEPTGAGEKQDLRVQASPIKQKRQVTGVRSAPQSTLVIKRQELGRSRRKQHLALSSSEEPVLLLPLGGGGSTSFLMRQCPSTLEEPLETLVCGPEEDPPVNCRRPKASTPNKVPITTSIPLPPTDQWRLTPLVNERSTVDFSSPRSSPLPFLPFQDNLDLEFNETSLRQSLGDSPQCPLLNAEMGEIVPELLDTSSPSSKVACELPGDNSLLEDLVLENMPENWSKLSLDLSFPDPENLETDLSWSQLLPHLK